MICITIRQESRRLAIVDMLNAARQCDLLEMRLDRFGNAPDLGDLFAKKPKPVLMSCRRTKDGGDWGGGEQERLAILRQCVVAKADYVEIELDIADQIRPLPPAQRVISYTNISETPAHILDIYEEARTKRPDVIKLVTHARTLEEAWPLVQVMAQATVPTVVVALGKASVTLSLLAKKMGAPWTYAALEHGMEGYPGQATAHDVRHIYQIDQINRATRFIGVTGAGERAAATMAALNAAMIHARLPFRCLPMGIGEVSEFRRPMDDVPLAAVVVDPDHQEAVQEMGLEMHGAARVTQTADLLLRKGETWHGMNTATPTWITALTAALHTRHGTDNVIKDRMVMIVGLDAKARILAREVQRRGGNAIVASHRRKACQALAQEIGCRAVQFEAIYSTMHDCLIVCDQETETSPNKPGGSGLHAGYLKYGLTVMDLTATLNRTPILSEARERGCTIVEPREVFLQQLQRQADMLIGKPVPAEVLVKAIAHLFEAA